uniref:Fibronectin type-III domain-containing protein n=1 Tax=Pygocentrus nattereri TaxID=42514 RepID=A0AAR2J7Q5_PYGNA
MFSTFPVYLLECLNDYDTEMVCQLWSERLNSCPEYKLNISLYTIPDEVFTCSFVNVSPNACECKFEMQGFVLERFKANLSRGEKELLFKEIDIAIKPKPPTIVSVNLTEKGNFLITWDTNYPSPLQKTFSDSLSTELTYGVKGGKNNVSELVIHLEKGRTEYEIVGRNLQPNSDYVVMARVSTEYNQNLRFSDYSQPYEFRTSMFLQVILKILIPILCVSLIIFISILFYCYVKIIKQWWDKIPVPKIAHSFEKTVNSTMFLPFLLESGNSSGSSFSNKCYLGSDSSGSSFLNQSITHSAYPSNESENSFSSLSKNLDPVIPTDFMYGPCNSCSVSVDSTQFTPLSTETIMVPGYQSVNELLDHGNKPEDQAFISYHNDINLIMVKTIPKNPLSVSSPGDDSMIIPVDDTYQSFPSLDQNTWSSDHSTELEQNIAQAVAQTAHHSMSCVNQQVHAPSLKGLCGPVLNISPGIQIDCSYQRV